MGLRGGKSGRLGASSAGLLATLLALAPAAVADHPGASDSFGAFNRFAEVRQTAMIAAPEPQPLTGVGENFELVANVPIDPGTQGVAASDLELHGNHAFVGSYGEGMVVIDISDPRQPKRVGKFACPGGQNDIQLSPDGRFAVMAIDTKNNGCHRGQEGAVYLDVSNPANPVELDFIPTQIGAHNTTLNYPILYVDNWVNDYSKLEIFDLSKPEKGFAKKVGNLDYGRENSPHDLIIDHRPDGRDLGYAASITGHDVLDLTDPTKPKRLQRITDPGVSISHQAEPNFDRSLLLVTDEFAGGAAGPGCGKGGATTVGGEIPVTGPTGDAADIGALHFYGLRPDGTVAGVNGQPKISTFNIPAQAQDDPEKACTIHVLWQAPAENRLVTAWYGRGTRVVDYSNAAKAKQLGFFIPTGADTWAAKPHNGYIFTGDIVRGMDVLRYTGESGNRWPTTSGPAEVQRAEEQGSGRRARSGSGHVAAATAAPGAVR